MVDPKSIEKIIHPYIDPNHPRKVVANGLPSSPGSASGIVVFSSADAEEAHRNGHSVILVRHETSPDDISGMHVADGILTSRGGLTSHAAVVARGMGKCCVSGCSDILIDYEKQEFIAKDIVVKKTDIITIDGSSGEVMLGKMPMIMHGFSSEFKTIMMWSDEIGKIAVRANAETITDCIAAIKYGAMGIGLCRTEHMFLEKSRILTMRQMILANNDVIKEKAIEDLLLEQCRDFIEIFKIINGLPINIRLLDPPIHEFLPSSTEDIAEFCKLSKLHKDHVLATLKHMKEINPMLGHRGVRLGITFPEIYSMQIRAIFSAYIEVVRSNVDVNLEIMLPLVMNRIEFDQIHASIINIQAEMEANSGVQIKYMTGTMIEVPRACIVANEIAKSAEYFSFGTNDLTQAMLCISRDDAFKFLTTYQERGIIDSDPFTTLDLVGVGEMIKMASIRGRSTRPDIKLGLCGEHGGHPDTVKFCAELNFDYVSCSPYRIPIARLAAAQAAISL